MHRCLEDSVMNSAVPRSNEECSVLSRSNEQRSELSRSYEQCSVLSRSNKQCAVRCLRVINSVQCAV